MGKTTMLSLIANEARSTGKLKTSVELYPHLAKACFLIALDNGGVNRERPEKQVNREIKAFLDATQYGDFLAEIDKWLGSLSEKHFDAVCVGCCDEHEERDRAFTLSTAPPFADTLLDTYFDEVC